MTYGHRLAIHCTGLRRMAFLRRQMGDDLMAQKIKVDPVIALPPLGATQHFAIKAARRLQIVNGKGQMKTGTGHHTLLDQGLQMRALCSGR